MTRRSRLVALTGLLAVAVAGANTVNASTPDPTDPDSSAPATTEADGPVASTDDPVATTDATGPVTTGGGTEPDLTGSGGNPDIDVTQFDVSEIEWTEIEDGIDEGWLTVPIDYADPDGATIDLYLVRNRATGDPADYIGPMLTNPGGPGAAGSEYGLYASFVFPEEVVERFDIIGFDPRGTGQSELFIDCIDDYDEWYGGVDITPETDEERQALLDNNEWFADQCVSKNAEILPFIGTNNAARDVDTMRRALGVDQLSWFGFSYGSEYGAVWATLFPSTVRAAILDGATDPESDPADGWRQQAAGFENTLGIFLSQCSAEPACAFHSDGDAEGAFDQLMAKIDEKSLPTTAGRPYLDLGLANLGVTTAMYGDSLWPQLEEALVAAQEGDGLPLLELADGYTGRRPDGTWDNLLEAFVSITCMDSDDRESQEDADALALEISTEIAPRFAPGTVGDTTCSFYPEVEDPRIDITGVGAGPIVVCGATGDAATPLSSSRAMAGDLEGGVLVVVDANQHTCFGATQCADQIFTDYLVDLVVPENETFCEV